MLVEDSYYNYLDIDAVRYVCIEYIVKASEFDRIHEDTYVIYIYIYIDRDSGFLR